MRILLYSPYSLRYNGGGERWIVEVVKRLHDCTFDIVTTTYAGEREKVQPDPTFGEECSKLDPVEVPARIVPPGLLIPNPRLFHVLESKASRSDCIIFNNVFPLQDLLILLIRRRTRCPVLSMYQAPLVNATVLTTMYRNLLFHRIARIFEAHHVLNKADHTALLNNGCKRVFLIPNGVDTSYFRPKPSARSKSKFIILFVGRLNHHKGFDLILELAAELLGRHPGDVELWVAGSGSLKDGAERISRKFPQFHMFGQCTQAQLREIYTEATMALLPSRWEGSPMVGIEGISSGLPLVTSDIPGFLGICVNGTNGFTVSPSQGVQGFLEAIERLYRIWKTQPDKLRTFQTSSRSIAVREFDWNVVIPRLESELIELCERAT